MSGVENGTPDSGPAFIAGRSHRLALRVGPVWSI